MMLVLFLTAFSFPSLAQDKITLSYKPEKGKAYRYIQDNLIETTQEMGGQEMKFNTDGHAVLKYEIEDVNAEGNFTVVYSYEEYKMHAKGMGRDTVMDMKNMLDKKTRTELNKLGKVIREITGDSSKASKGLSSMNLSGGANFQILPDHPVSIGEKWNRTSSDTTNADESKMVYRRNIDYTLVGKETKGKYECLKVELKGSIELTGKMKQMNMDMAMEGGGETTGTFWFDPNSGMMVEEVNNTTLEMTLALTGQAQMTIPVTQKMTITHKLSE